MSFKLGSIHLIGLALFGLGIGFPFIGLEVWPTEVIAPLDSNKASPVKVSNASGRIVTKSRKRREERKIRAYFPFRDLKPLDVLVDRPIVITDQDEFILESDERWGILAERNRLKDVEWNCRRLGLGPKYPDVLTASVTIDRLEERNWQKWEADGRSVNERN